MGCGRHGAFCWGIVHPTTLITGRNGKYGVCEHGMLEWLMTDLLLALSVVPRDFWAWTVHFSGYWLLLLSAVLALTEFLLIRRKSTESRKRTSRN